MGEILERAGMVIPRRMRRRTPASTTPLSHASGPNDVWSLAAGNDAHDGRTPYTPKATLQALIDAYDLEPGDVVRVDTGTYNLTSDVLLGSDDSGSATGYVTILGSVQGAVLNRQSTASGANAIQLDGQDYIRLQNLHLTGGQDGLYISSHTKHYEIRDCAIYGNNGSRPRNSTTSSGSRG